MKKLLVVLVVLLALASSVSAQEVTRVVARDPEAGSFSGFSYSYSLSGKAAAELNTQLGGTVLMSTSGVRQLQRELELSSSKWGNRGRNQQPIGYFTGASHIMFVSAFQEKQDRTSFRVGRSKAQFRQVRVVVAIREVEIKTREQVATYRGSGSATENSNLHLNLGRFFKQTQFSRSSNEDLSLRAIREAIQNALASGRNKRPMQSVRQELSRPRSEPDKDGKVFGTVESVKDQDSNRDPYDYYHR